MHSPIAATALLEPIPRSPIHPKAAARFPAAFRALFRFPTRTVRKPQEVVVLVTIEACLMVDTDDRQWGRHTRHHRNRENGEKSRTVCARIADGRRHESPLSAMLKQLKWSVFFELTYPTKSQATGLR